MLTTPAIDPPECPVCLQAYDGDSATIPRVLACGHSACDSCLSLLPQPFPNTIRCPACTQLVKFSDPSSLPKNIDLLRLSSVLQNPQSKNPRNPKNPIKVQPLPSQFIPNLWSEEFYLIWKDWIIPENEVVLDPGQRDCSFSLLRGRCLSESASENDKVSLVKIGSFRCDDDIKLNYSYAAKILWVLHRMKVDERDELGFIFRISSCRQSRVCKIYGLWYNFDDEALYMVSERYVNNCPENLNSWSNGFFPSWGNEYMGWWGSVDLSGSASFSMVAMEMCEAIAVLHSKGLFTGCLAIRCFCFDKFGHVYVDLNETLLNSRRFSRLVKEAIAGGRDVKNGEISLSDNSLETLMFVSPEVLLEILKETSIGIECETKVEIGYGSDIWSLACVLLSLLSGKPFVKLMHDYFRIPVLLPSTEEGSGYIGLYGNWKNNVMTLLQDKFGSEHAFLQENLSNCLDFDPANRPIAIDMWKCMRQLFIRPEFDILASLPLSDKKEEKKGVGLFLGELYMLGEEPKKKSEKQLTNGMQDANENCKHDAVQFEEMSRDLVDGLPEGHIRCINLKSHLDCITGLAVGGGFLFSSSFDKTVQVWSLQDFAHVHTFKGHQHKVMALVFVDKERPLCISGDSGGGIMIWDACYPFSQEPIKKLYEQKDWRYSGIHCLAVSGSEYLYTGSGDKSIKAWSLQDYSLSYVMNGHNSVVSTLAVSGGVLYSGSWDGTLRLWCLSDHSPLAVLGEDMPGNVTSVLSLVAYHQGLLVVHENGSVKIWRDKYLLKSSQVHKNAIFSVSVEGKWLFTGGWDKVVNVQELVVDDFQADVIQIGYIACDAVITALLYLQGKLFIGQADGLIKVCYYGS